MTMSTPNRTTSRRQFLTQAAGMLIGSASLGLVKAANAFSLNDLAVSDAIDVVKLAKTKAEVLKEEVSKWKSVCSDDDRFVVLRYVPIWLTPAQVAGEKIAKLTVDNKKVDSDKVMQQSLLLKGHLVELNMEANNLSSAGIIRELEEFIETADIIIDVGKSASWNVVYSDNTMIKYVFLHLPFWVLP